MDTKGSVSSRTPSAVKAAPLSVEKWLLPLLLLVMIESVDSRLCAAGSCAILCFVPRITFHCLLTAPSLLQSLAFHMVAVNRAANPE